MIIQKVAHYTDSILTQEMARMELEGGQVVVAWYTNQENSQSVVHSHPYYELIIPFAGSSVRYSADGNIYDVGLGEMILFPAEHFLSGTNVLDACHASGFSNYTSFLKSFRSLYGITPSEYRNKLRSAVERERTRDIEKNSAPPLDSNATS